MEDFAEVHELLLDRCMRYDGHRIAGREDDLTVGECHAAERPWLLELPSSPFDCRKAVREKVDAYQTARVDRNRYSAPHNPLGPHNPLKGDCDQRQTPRHKLQLGWVTLA